ncbi:hypothetical protein RRG08_033161 [Elysia crispata]|uniref:Uncharacterized protein n=1 Tax=Elysia crispata TaxID=231223 RepID=A0AAE0YYC5_9GAST|nr:hypothetical protein RRG08_033161 [Elysia crispata]
MVFLQSRANLSIMEKLKVLYEKQISNNNRKTKPAYITVQVLNREALGTRGRVIQDFVSGQPGIGPTQSRANPEQQLQPGLCNQ